MKLGQRCKDPLTGRIGYVVRFIGGQAMARDDEGQMFRAGPKCGRPSCAGQPCRIKVFGVPGGWMGGERIDGDKARVTDGDPIWNGCVIQATEAEIEPVAATAAGSA